MNLQFYGAAGQVTGSCMVLNTGRGRLMVDCGMFQGQHENDERNYSSLNFSPCDIDWVVLTHAHIDHSGLLPRFVKLGYRGPIYGTPATVDLTPLMLLDSVQIQKYDSDWRTKKNIRRGGPKIDPLYCKDDALATQKLLKPIPYGEWLELNRYVKIRLLEAGHILGSASLQVKVRTAETETVVVFSGDVGNRPVPILRDPAVIEKADVLVLESTYGNRLHDYAVDHRDLLKNILMEAVPKRGKVIIPSFAVGRVQEVLYEINYLVENKILQGMSTFVDSPLATEVSNVYMRHTEAYDKEAQDLVKSGDDPFEFPGLKYLKTSEESISLNSFEGPATIIAPSGMCNAGRVLHHLKHHLWNEQNTIVFVGYQARGTLGRDILEGKSPVFIHGEEISVKAKVVNIPGFSAHADGNGLIQWLKGFQSPPSVLFLNHGEPEAASALAERIHAEMQWDNIVLAQEKTDYSLERNPRCAPLQKEIPADFEGFNIATVSQRIERLQGEVKTALNDLSEEMRKWSQICGKDGKTVFEGWNALFQEIFEKLNANFLEQVSFLVASMAKDVKFSSNEINPSSYLQEFFDRKIAEIKMFGQNFPQEFSEIQGMESKTPIKQQRLKPRQK